MIQSLYRLWPFAMPYRYWLGIGVISSVFYAGLTITTAYTLKHLLDHAIARDIPHFLQYVWLMIGVSLLMFFMQFVKQYTIEKYANSTNRDLRK